MIITLAGSNHFALNAELHQLVNSFIKEQGDLALEQLDGEEASYERLQEAVQSLPFLANKKMVVLKSPGANKQFLDQFESLLPNIPETTDLVIVEPKVDKRSSYFKTLKSKTDFREFNDLDSNGLANWLVKEVKERGGALSSGDSRYLVERVGSNQQLLSNELDKLLSYAPGITRQTIDLLTDQTPQSTIFELLDAAFAGNTKRAIRLYQEQRALKIEPQQVLAMLAWQLHVLAIVKAAGDRSTDEIAKQAKLSPFVVRKTQNIARKLSLVQVKRLVHDALTLDVRLKSESIDADEALQYFLLTISS